MWINGPSYGAGHLWPMAPLHEVCHASTFISRREPLETLRFDRRW